jgi:hypothetical protein
VLCQPVTKVKLIFIADVYYYCSPAFRRAETKAETELLLLMLRCVRPAYSNTFDGGSFS